MADAAQPLFANDCYALLADRVEQGTLTARALSSTEIVSNYAMSGQGRVEPARTWTLAADLGSYPRLTSPDVLSEALYHLSLHELRLDLATDGTFDAGAKWPGVWTRDASYSILLSLAAIEPEASKESLRAKVRRGRIVQDNGTGGSWPVSTDRLVWGLAAWEIYRVTGDPAWLQEIYPVLRDSIADDLATVVDPATGLARGETSFLDWREQTYPRWMQPKDIYQSQALSTNAVFYRTLRILGEMCEELSLPRGLWDTLADRVRESIDSLFWQEGPGHYGEFRYGGVFPVLSPRAEALGAALAMLFDIATPAQQARLLRSQPMMDFGIPTVFPQQPGIPPYHNDSVWPFVQAFWTIATARHGDMANVLHGIAAIQRASALFLTNKENFVASTGNAAGTQVNSDRQLWSVAGNLALTYRVLFGMRFERDGLHFQPVVPQPLAGERRLAGFRYRGAVLDVQVRGSGSTIRSFSLDGMTTTPIVPATLTGSHRIVIELTETDGPEMPLRIVPATVAPETPVVRLVDDQFRWDAIDTAVTYRCFQNGRMMGETAGLQWQRMPQASGACQVCAVDADGTASFLSEPVHAGPPAIVVPVQSNGEPIDLEQHGTSGLMLSVQAPAGRYAATFHYSNGAGPVNTNNCCAIRTLVVDGEPVGPIVMPQRGSSEWDNFGSSSAQVVTLSGGTHAVELRLLSTDANMNGVENRARIASLILTPLE